MVDKVWWEWQQQDPKTRTIAYKRVRHGGQQTTLADVMLMLGDCPGRRGEGLHGYERRGAVLYLLAAFNHSWCIYLPPGRSDSTPCFVFSKAEAALPLYHTRFCIICPKNDVLRILVQIGSLSNHLGLAGRTLYKMTYRVGGRNEGTSHITASSLPPEIHSHRPKCKPPPETAPATRRLPGVQITSSAAVLNFFCAATTRPSTLGATLYTPFPR